ncbi:MAG: ketol-acid reductoisomerase [Gemmatimonadetes bacterium]|nr:ketol-acid reductoisomerase [Gemmatimonadota bacterium]
MRVYGREDADPRRLHERRIAVIGYGSQGHAHALNLRDSGARVHIGVREGRTAEAARADGFEVLAVAVAVRHADFVSLLIPDTAQPRVWEEHVAPNLVRGSTVLFAHGFNVHYGQILPAQNADVVLVAPKSPGRMVRSEYIAGRGVPALIAVHQDASGSARALALSYADALGSTRAGVLETTFADETETDLFGEQAVLCGGLSALIQAGFDTLTEAGYSPELAYFECLHEMKLIVDLVYAGGLDGMRRGVSDTAEYGDYVSGKRIVGEAAREAMRQVLADVRSGCFARQWIAESARGGPEFERMRQAQRAHPIEAVGASLRDRMAWLRPA